ncbi:hypothetical protein F8279_05145 [Micromonospora sp. AMSO1212t]|uniref:hypothetical protein n=1 Tax=Micromonospora sp. AMSO1212t TaxID=2650565 RepID=UPI00124B1E55|nr:hypothetical protein [Micromonospora sp. AMSO1212t]KAB1908906.1 hypothetical protein F8279_05145 [Micromonospora sp. AMSO1212t]
MAADYYYADAENGDHVDDPSEDALLMLIDELNHDDNTFVTINPADDDPAWYASISLLDDGAYEVERRDADQRIHDFTTETDRGDIAKNLTIWLAGRHYPNRPG